MDGGATKREEHKTQAVLKEKGITQVKEETTRVNSEGSKFGSPTSERVRLYTHDDTYGVNSKDKSSPKLCKRPGSVEEARRCPLQKERREAARVETRVEMRVVVRTDIAWATRNTYYVGGWQEGEKLSRGGAACSDRSDTRNPRLG